MNRRMIGIVVGSMLVVAGLITLLRVPYFYYHSSHQGEKLLKNASQLTASSNPSSQPSEKAAKTAPKGLLGEIDIPALQVKAPIIEGTNDAQLGIGAGHLPSSVMPGQIGTSIIAAHNATWFRHIGGLIPGDVIETTTKDGTKTFTVTKHKVVHQGTPVYNTASATIVLETCYPTDALYLTPYRLLVYGKLTQSRTSKDRIVGSVVCPHYTASIPVKIRKQGITLSTNSLPMGTLTYSGHPSNAFVQSNNPLNASAVAVQLYLAWAHASADKDTNSLQGLRPSTKAMLNPLYGRSLQSLTYPGHFNVVLTVDGTTLKRMKATATIRVNTGNDYHLTILYSVQGDEITIHKMSFAVLN